MGNWRFVICPHLILVYIRVRPRFFDQVGHQTTKGQLISKANCQAVNSSKKTNE